MDTAASHHNTETLDLRPMSPPQRHETIFPTLENLQKGQSLRIINDHDPKPLYYKLQAEQPGAFEFDYEEGGPVDWIVNIKKMM